MRAAVSNNLFQYEVTATRSIAEADWHQIGAQSDKEVNVHLETTGFSIYVETSKYDYDVLSQKLGNCESG